MNGHLIAKVCDSTTHRPGEAEACGKLIAAAPELLAALKALMIPPDTKEVDGRFTCQYCGREWSAMAGDDVPEHCPSDDCPAHIARAAIVAAEGRGRDENGKGTR